VSTPSPTVRRRRLAAELRRLRERADLTGDDVADRLKWSASKISRIETAKTGAKISDVRKLLELYGVGASHLDELIALARDAERKGWWEAYSDATGEEYAAFIGLEAEAEYAGQWENQVIPGLFQTEEYARRLTQAVQPIATLPPSKVEARVEARLRRQEVLTREKPLQLSIVLDESTLMRKYGDRAVMRAQMERVIELAQLPNVTLRVLPLDGTHPLSIGSFIQLRFERVYDITFHDVVYVEQLMSSFYFEEELDTYRYTLAFDQLVAAALSPEESLELVAQTKDKVWR
jgi:transcriptional regulator with XRE-family HTH domain